jgi:hypothetical protein
MARRNVLMPILGLIFISLGGLLLHLRIHPTSAEASNWIPVIFGVLSIVVLPVMFCSRRTVALAYLINAVTIIVGVVAMTMHSVEHWQGPVTLDAILLKSTLADNLILLAKLPLAHVILQRVRGKGSR